MRIHAGLTVFVVAVAAVCPCYGAMQANGDAGLIALTQQPYASLTDFRERLQDLEQALADQNDPRAIFAAMYIVLTENGAELIGQDYFDDGEWVAALMISFGNYYRQAFFDYESGRTDQVPPAWRVTFDAAADDTITTFQHGLLGVHTHVNRDLAYALADVTPPSDRARRFADFVRTNDFIVAASDEVESAASAFDSNLAQLDVRLRNVDERVLKRVVTRWRFRAWQDAATVSAWRESPAGPFLGALRDSLIGRQAERFRDSNALYALGNAGDWPMLLPLPTHGKRYPSASIATDLFVTQFPISQ